MDKEVLVTNLFEKISEDEAKVLNALRYLKKYPGGGKLQIRVKAEPGRPKEVDVEAIVKMGKAKV